MSEGDSTMTVVPISSAQGKRRSPAYRAEQARVMREQGSSFQSIADALGYSDRSAACKAAARGHAAWMLASDEDARLTQLRETEMMMSALRPRIESDEPDEKAIELGLKVMDRQAKLLELYKQRPSTTATTVDVPNTAAIDKLQAVQDLQAFIDSLDPWTLAQLQSQPPDDGQWDDEEQHCDSHTGTSFNEGDGATGQAIDSNDDDDDVFEIEEDVPPGKWIDGRFYPDPIPAADRVPELSADETARAVRTAFSMDE
jgi:hypothetical protein